MPTGTPKCSQFLPGQLQNFCLQQSFVSSQLRQGTAEELLVQEMSPMEGNQSSKPEEG